MQSFKGSLELDQLLVVCASSWGSLAGLGAIGPWIRPAQFFILLFKLFQASFEGSIELGQFLIIGSSSLDLLANSFDCDAELVNESAELFIIVLFFDMRALWYFLASALSIL